MDPKTIATRKALAIGRIEGALDVLVKSYKFSPNVKETMATYPNYPSSGTMAGTMMRRDANLSDLYRIEAIADLIEDVLKMAKYPKYPSSGTMSGTMNKQKVEV